MNSELSHFQDGFVQALLAPDGDLPAHLRALVDQPGLSVHRNTVLKDCIDALQANYPAILRLVGEEWFRAVAALHARAQPPGDTRLLLYGMDFPEFLRGFPPAAELPYLHGVALLDRFWTEAHVAADAVALASAVLTGLPLEQLDELVLAPHSAAAGPGLRISPSPPSGSAIGAPRPRAWTAATAAMSWSGRARAPCSCGRPVP